MLSSIKIWAWAFVAGVLMTVAMFAVWKAGAVGGGFVLTMASTVLTLIVAVAAVLTLVVESRDGREAAGERALDTWPSAQPSAAPRLEPPGQVDAPLGAAAPKFHVETQGGPAYIAETMRFTSGRPGRGAPAEASEGGTSHVD